MRLCLPAWPAATWQVLSACSNLGQGPEVVPGGDSNVPDSVGGKSMRFCLSAWPAATWASLGWKAKQRITNASG